jgi:tetratricopeptide (TPR) repeat protein
VFAKLGAGTRSRSPAGVAPPPAGRDSSAARASTASPAPPLGAAGADSGSAWKLAAFCAALVAAGAATARLLLAPEPPRPAPATAATVATVSAVGEIAAPTFVAAPPRPPAPLAEPAGIPEEDRTLAVALAEALRGRALLSREDVAQAETLFQRHAGEEPIRQLLEAVLLGAAAQERQQRRFAEAVEHVRRAVAVSPASTRARLLLLSILIDTGDWTGAEAAARDLLALEPGNGDALEGLAFALFRQDRNREAAEALREALAARPSESARGMLERIEKNLADERGMTERLLSHFHVRYDGEAHEDVGREILRALERHYATLTTTLDHRPEGTIPVILFARERYLDASGAPTWSGGVFDQIDGRIRIPIGGLGPGLAADIDGVLVHELTHAFIHDRSRGLAPRELHEGLAQYMEGKRVADLLSREQVTALADGRVGGVGGYYLGALSFVEFLMAARGQGGMNDLLRAIGDTGDVNEAFRQVHGVDLAAARQAWMERLRQQYGS